MPYISPKDAAALARKAATVEPPEHASTTTMTTTTTTTSADTETPVVAETPAPISHADSIDDVDADAESPGLTSCGTTDSSSSVRTLSSDSATMATLSDKLEDVHIEHQEAKRPGDDDDGFAPCPVAVASYHAGLYAFTKWLYDEARDAAKPKPQHRLSPSSTVPVA